MSAVWKCPDGPVRIEWSVTRDDEPIWLHNMNVRVPIGGVPEFTDAIVVSTHAKATERSQPDMVHSGLDLIPLVGRSIPTSALAARFTLSSMALQTSSVTIHCS